jgi:hypothetical protein
MKEIDYVSFFHHWIVENNHTPMLEWISPTSPVVLEYSEPSLILVALRDNFTGNYFLFHFLSFLKITTTKYRRVSNIRGNDCFSEKVQCPCCEKAECLTGERGRRSGVCETDQKRERN